MTAYLPKDHASTEDKKRIADLIFCQKRTAVVLGNAITSVSVTMHKYFENCRENRMWTATFCQCDPFFCRVLARTCRLRALSEGQHSGDSMNPSAVGFGGFYCSRRKLRNRPAAVSPLALQLARLPVQAPILFFLLVSSSRIVPSPLFFKKEKRQITT